jgi:hypothetical protein
LRYFLRVVSVTFVVSVIVSVGYFYPISHTIVRNGASLATEGSEIFGIADPTLIGEAKSIQSSQLAAIRSAGITSVRVDADWSWVQPTSPANFDWTQLDQEIDEIRAAGMSVDIIIDGCPRWATSPKDAKYSSPQPASAMLYATWAADVAARYAPKGVHYFEIWNEPNNEQFWQPRPNPSAYVADLKAASVAIKAIDPSAFIISGGLAPERTDGVNYSPIDFLKAMYAAGAKGSFDALGYHPYSFPALPDTYEPWSAWSQMDDTNPSIRSVMISNGDSDKSVWITEFGAPSGGPRGVGEAAQRTALYVAIAYAKSTSWIGAFYIYTWQDTIGGPSVDNWFGLLSSMGSPKLAYSTVVTMLRSGSGS